MKLEIMIKSDATNNYYKFRYCTVTPCKECTLNDIKHICDGIIYKEDYEYAKSNYPEHFI